MLGFGFHSRWMDVRGKWQAREGGMSLVPVKVLVGLARPFHEGFSLQAGSMQ